MLLNVESLSHEIPEEIPDDILEEVLNGPLSDFHFELISIRNPDIVEAILNYAEKINPQLIITLPTVHNLLYKLTHRDIIKGLIRNSELPVLLLKDKERPA